MIDFDFVILGFPKCGTTALIELLGSNPDIHIDKLNKNGIESKFHKEKISKRLKDAVKRCNAEYKESGKKIRGHKFTAYIYDSDSINSLLRENKNALYIVMIREPLSSLVSWHRMHKEMAKEWPVGKHFTTKSKENKEFYANCSIADYYREFASSRLNYVKHFRNLRSLIPEDNLLVISQEALANNKAGCLNRIFEKLGSSHRVEHNDSAHKSFGESKRKDAQLPADIQLDLESSYEELLNELRSIKNSDLVFKR